MPGGLRNKKIYVESYGCTFNHADTEKLVELAKSQGCSLVYPEEAEVFIINTCTVVERTERTMLRRIAAFSDREVVVTGCMPVVQMDRIEAVCPARVITPGELTRCSGRIGAAVAPGVGVVQIATGCLGHCSYCITRFARGPLASYPAEQILDEVSRLVRGGATEIQLTGQDVSAWGLDCQETFAGLLGEVLELPGDFMVRVGMMNPATSREIAGELAGLFSHEKCFAFAHLPVQSGSDHVLAAMNRGYTAEDFCGIAGTLRRSVPDIRISTDFITGFPAERDEDFRHSLALLERIRPGKVNITRYSPRPKTPSADLYDMPDWVKKERSRALTRAAAAIYADSNSALKGSVCAVIVTEQGKPGTVIARDKSYRLFVISEALPVGTRCQVEVTGHRTHYLTARRLE